MKEVYVGIDVHKDENVFGSAKDDRSAPEIIGQCSSAMGSPIPIDQL